MSKLYFAYGSNLWLQQIKERCPENKQIGLGKLPDYRWIISSRGYANIIESKNDYVLGIIYEISESDEAILDIKEGVKSGSYHKKYFTIDNNGKSLECLIYIDPIINEGSPKEEYISRINKGIKDAGFTKEYIDKYIRQYIP